MKLTGTWKVIYVASRKERKTAEQLEIEGIPRYLPIIKTLRQWSDRKKWVEVPLFNGYMFVKPKPQDRDKVLTVPGVVKYLRYNNADAIISEKELNIIQAVVEKGYDISEFDPSTSFEKGLKIQVVQGPFKDKFGEIIRIDKDNYALIAFEQFDRVFKVKLPKQILKKIE